MSEQKVIKFKAWNKETKEMMQVDQITLAHNATRFGTGIMDSHNDLHSMIDIELMQFTGLKDKNGKEIYEGDVVRWDDASVGSYWRAAEVIYEPGHFTFRTIPKLCVNCFKRERHDFKMGSFAYCPDTANYGNVMEVIGNIYENPELITQ